MYIAIAENEGNQPAPIEHWLAESWHDCKGFAAAADFLGHARSPAARARSDARGPKPRRGRRGRNWSVLHDPSPYLLAVELVPEPAYRVDRERTKAVRQLRAESCIHDVEARLDVATTETPMRCGAFVLALAVAGGTPAQPVQLSDSQFNAQVVGLVAVAETFEGFALGTYPPPVMLANAAYTAASPVIEAGAWCPLSRCLGERASIDGARSFTAFPPGTTHFGTNVLYASVGQVLRVTVIGNGGTLVVALPPSPPNFSPSGHFFGFADTQGVLSVAFEQPGGITNYSFDNVVTAGSTQTPSAISVPTLERPILIALSLMLAVASVFAVSPRRPRR